MMRSRAARRRATSGLLAVLLTVPLFVFEHHHEAKHEGRTVHLEVPHGPHHSPAPELSERVTSTAPYGPVALTAVPVPTIDEVVVRSADLPPTATDHPARPPPPPGRPRAPPIGS